MRRRLVTGTLTAAAIFGVLAGVASGRENGSDPGVRAAACPCDIDSGRIPGSSLTWSAEVGRNAPTLTYLLIDVLADGARRATYGAGLPNSLPPRRIRGVEARPLARPTRSALAYGAVGRRIRRVRVFFSSGTSPRSVRTIAAPPDLGVNFRYFIVATRVSRDDADRPRVTRRIVGFDADGDRVNSTRRIVLANP